MNSLKSKFTLVILLLGGSCQVLAHTGSHGNSSLHHYVTIGDHAAVILLLVLSSLGVVTYLARNLAGIRTVEVRK